MDFVESTAIDDAVEPIIKHVATPVFTVKVIRKKAFLLCHLDLLNLPSSNQV